MKDLIKRQEEELKCKISTSQDFGGLSFPICGYEKAEENLKNFISKVRKETAEKVCDKMIEEKKVIRDNPADFFSSINLGKADAYNSRIEEEKEIKSQILKEIN